MDNDLRYFKATYQKIQKDMDRLIGSATPSYLRSVYDQMEQVLEPVRRQHQEFARAIRLSGNVSTYLTEISQSNEIWQNMMNQVKASSCVFEDLTYTHQSWIDRFNPMQDSIDRFQAELKMSLGDVAYRMTMAEQLFAGIDFEAMRRAIGLPEPVFARLENKIDDMALTYKKLTLSIKTLPDLTHLPIVAIPGATREIFLTGYIIDSISTPDKSDCEKDASEEQLVSEAEQETSCCIELLQDVNPALVRPYKGARDALRNKNTDRSRHIFSSLRELWSHLLRHLAPEEDVLSWVLSNDKKLLDKGKPTRKARIKYIFRSLNHTPLTDFIDQDTGALMKMLELFNHMHKLDLEMTDEELRVLMLRCDSWLTYILQIKKETK